MKEATFIFEVHQGSNLSSIPTSEKKTKNEIWSYRTYLWRSDLNRTEWKEPAAQRECVSTGQAHIRSALAKWYSLARAREQFPSRRAPARVLACSALHGRMGLGPCARPMRTHGTATRPGSGARFHRASVSGQIGSRRWPRTVFF
jgi:hypothetical protein